MKNTEHKERCPSKDSLSRLVIWKERITGGEGLYPFSKLSKKHPGLAHGSQYGRA
jgi:hypothetical protein